MEREAPSADIDCLGRFYILVREPGRDRQPYFVTRRGVHLEKYMINLKEYEALVRIKKTQLVPLILREDVIPEIAFLDACLRVLIRSCGLSGLRVSVLGRELTYGSDPPAAVINIDRSEGRFTITNVVWSDGRPNQGLQNKGSDCFFSDLKNIFKFDMSADEFKRITGEEFGLDFSLKMSLAEHAQNVGQFYEEMDVDLRKNTALSLSDLHEQRVEAMNTSLERINNMLKKINPAVPSVCPGYFFAKKYDTIIIRSHFGKLSLGKFPTVVETSFQVLSEDGASIDLNFTVTISIHNQESTGPYVCYSLIHRRDTPVTYEGRIFLNAEGNEHLPDANRSSELEPNNSCSKVPVTRIFSPPSNNSFFLQRADSIHEAKRGRKYPPWEF